MGGEAEQLVPKLAGHKDAIQSSLSASPADAEAFRRDPLKALAKAFPDLGLRQRPRDRASELVSACTSLTLDAPDPAVLTLFVKSGTTLPGARPTSPRSGVTPPA